MKNQHKSRVWQKMLSILMLLMLTASVLKAQISGLVFRDFNANGIKENTTTYNEPGIGGMTIKAYNSAGTLVGTTTSSSTGAYSFTGLTLPLRIEFTGYK